MDLNKGIKMSENYYSCGKGFGWARKKYYCELCKEEFCRGCITQNKLSWGIYGEPRYELVLRKNTVGYRLLEPLNFSKTYMLCKLCKDKISEKIEGLKVEIKNRKR